MTELGIRLKEAREEKAMSLDDLQAATKIQKRYLTALEEGNYDIIPGKFYVRAFIKQYAEAVGLDADQLFEEHKKDIPNHDDVSEKISGMNLQKEMPKPASKALELLPTILVILGVIVVIAIVYAIIQFANHKNSDNHNAASEKAITQSESKYEIPKDSTLKENQKNSSEKETDTKKETKENENKKEENDSDKLEIKAAGTEGSLTTYEVSGADKIELELKASDSSWIRVRDENSSSLKEGTLKKDETYKKDITDQKQVDIRTGYAPNLKIKINGKVLSYELDPKKVMAQTIKIVNKKEEKSS